MADDRLSGLKLDLAVARACDFPCSVGGPHDWIPSLATACARCGHILPLYSTQIEAAMDVEDRIAELNLKREYVLALWSITGVDHAKFSSETDWLLVHASAEHRCRAALAAIGAKD